MNDNHYNEKELNVTSWIESATDDELFSKSILKHRDAPPSGVCFHSQQMAEKYMKGLVIFYKKEFPKIHDLLRLETLILEIEPLIKEIHKDLELLNRYYSETRYPGDFEEFTWEDAEKAYESAENIKNFVFSRINNN